MLKPVHLTAALRWFCGARRSSSRLAAAWSTRQVRWCLITACDIGIGLTPATSAPGLRLAASTSAPPTADGAEPPWHTIRRVATHAIGYSVRGSPRGPLDADGTYAGCAAAQASVRRYARRQCGARCGREGALKGRGCDHHHVEHRARHVVLLCLVVRASLHACCRVWHIIECGVSYATEY